MRAAGHLFAERGLENVSARDIIRAAGQKNESALQYHFRDRPGLIAAIIEERMAQVARRRDALFDERAGSAETLGLRDACMLMVEPPFLLCRSDRGYRDFIAVFGHALLSSRESVSDMLDRQRSRHQQKILGAIRGHVTVTAPLLPRRIENVSRFATLMMSARARDGGTFRGRNAQLFLNDLADTMVAMLQAPVSAATAAYLEDA